MGQLIGWIVKGLQWGGPAAIGYFTNDIARWGAKVTGTEAKVVNDSGTGFKPWYIILVTAVAGAALFVGLKMFAGRKKLFSLLALCAVLQYTIGGPVMPENFDVLKGSLLFSIAASVTDTKSIPYCPQFITFNIGTVPTSLKIEIAGDGVIYSIDGTGLTNLNGIRLVGELPSNQYVYEIANGYIQKNASFTIANAHAGQLDVYGWSEQPGNGYVMHNQAKAFANASIEVDDFFYAAFPSAAATDNFTVTWSNGKTETLTRVELQMRLAYKQEVVATKYNVDNIERTVKKIQFNGAADQAFYYTRWNYARGTVRQTL